MLKTDYIERMLKPIQPSKPVEMKQCGIRPIVEMLLEKDGQVTGPKLAKVAGITKESGNKYLRTFRDQGWLVGKLVSVRHKSEKGYVTTSRIAVYKEVK